VIFHNIIIFYCISIKKNAAFMAFQKKSYRTQTFEQQCTLLMLKLRKR